MTYKWNAYHLYGKVGEKFLQMVLVFFWTPKTGTGLSCTIYKILVNFSLSLDLRLSTGNPNKWYRRLMSSQ